jgi:opacity protein-like surface antigen
VRKFVILFVSLFAAASVVYAQTPSRGDVFFGYSYSGGDVFTRSPLYIPQSHGVAMNGWEGSIEGKVGPWVGLVFDIAGHHGSHDFAFCPPPALAVGCGQVNVQASEHTYLFGPQVSFSEGRFSPFLHVLVGVAHLADSHGGVSNSDNSLGVAAGGGVDYRVIDHVAARLQLDDMRTHFFGDTHNHLRFSAGLDFRF